MVEKLEQEIKSCQDKADLNSKNLFELEALNPYYDFWVDGFGDQGIRSLILNEVIPVLNGRINFWLQFLMDGKIKVNFDRDLEEKIERFPGDGDAFVYNSLSGGEHSRVDLAISQGFAQVMMMTSGACPEFVALDEVGAHLDRPGIVSVHKMILELSKNRQVIVITHDPDLLDLLDGCDVIEVEKNKFTRIKNIISNTN
jgi:DNA repair exonuclease SbcCD ATPase subunit